MCTRCGKNQRDGTCHEGREHAICWQEVGTVPGRFETGGEGEDASRTCPLHGSFRWRRAMTYSTLALFPGNRWAKTAGALAEFCAGVLGYRPWDDTLTLQPGNGRVHLIVCQTLSVSALLTIQKYVLRYIGSYLKPITTTSNTLSGWRVVKGPTAGDIIKLASQDQHYRTVSTVSPLEGSAYVQVMNDEPFKEDLRAAWGRGLLEGKTVWGWGREILAMTFLEGAAEARVYCFNNIWQQAGNKGGSQRQIWARGGTMDENPANTPEDIRQTLETFPEWEREARRTGMMTVLKGRILPEFSVKIHVYDDALNNVLLDAKGKPSDLPCYISIDPHDIRPWVIKVIAIDQQGVWYIVDEWPKGLFHKMSHFGHAEPNFGGSMKEYAGPGGVLERLLAAIPGGRARVQGWFMDPAFGNTTTTSTGKTLKESLAQDFGYYFDTDLPRALEPGHHKIRDLLRGSWVPQTEPDALHYPHLKVASSCRNMIFAGLNYVTEEARHPGDVSEKPADIGKDDWDCIRYPAMSKRVFYTNWLTIGERKAAYQSKIRGNLAGARY